MILSYRFSLFSPQKREGRGGRENNHAPQPISHKKGQTLDLLLQLKRPNHWTIPLWTSCQVIISIYPLKLPLVNTIILPNKILSDSTNYPLSSIRNKKLKQHNICTLYQSISHFPASCYIPQLYQGIWPGYKLIEEVSYLNWFLENNCLKQKGLQ